jgi:hypothetical protein
MAHHIHPVLAQKCEAVGWEINPEKPQKESLDKLLTTLKKSINRVRGQKLTPKEEKEERALLKKATGELSQNVASILALAKAAKSAKMEKLARSLSKAKATELTRCLLHLQRNADKVRKGSADYNEAWREIEAEYFYKVSLYQAELHLRERKGNA